MFSEVQALSGACALSPLLLLLVGEEMHQAHVRAPGEVWAGVLVVVARHLVVPGDMTNGVTSRRPGVVMLDSDAVFRAQIGDEPGGLNQHMIVVAQLLRVAACLPKDRYGPESRS